MAKPAPHTRFLTLPTPTTGPNDCISSEGAERDTPGKRIATMIQAPAGSSPCLESGGPSFLQSGSAR
jgi:hypothetical protein